jgi:glutaredoxin
MADGVQVYGTDWCGVTFGVREYLTKARIPYDYYNIEQDPDADGFVLAMNDGRRRFPLVVVEERIIASPTIAQLQQVLNEHRIRSI